MKFRVGYLEGEGIPVLEYVDQLPTGEEQMVELVGCTIGNPSVTSTPHMRGLTYYFTLAVINRAPICHSNLLIRSYPLGTRKVSHNNSVYDIDELEVSDQSTLYAILKEVTPAVTEIQLEFSAFYKFVSEVAAETRSNYSIASSVAWYKIAPLMRDSVKAVLITLSQDNSYSDAFTSLMREWINGSVGESGVMGMTAEDVDKAVLQVARNVTGEEDRQRQILSEVFVAQFLNSLVPSDQEAYDGHIYKTELGVFQRVDLSKALRYLKGEITYDSM